MTLTYLSEHADSARTALDLAARESELFHAAFIAAKPATELLFRIVAATRAEATMRGVLTPESKQT